MYTAALLAIICLGLVASVAHVDAMRQPSPEDLGYYDDDETLGYYDDDETPAVGSFMILSIIGMVAILRKRNRI